VLHDAGQRHRQGAGQLAHRRGTAGKPLNDQPARGVSQRVEDRVQVGKLVNHILKYDRQSADSQVTT